MAPIVASDFGPQDKDVKTSVDQYADLFTGVRKDVGKISSEVRLPYRFSCDGSDRVEASRAGSSVSERPWWQRPWLPSRGRCCAYAVGCGPSP